ncbi:MAG: molybdate ABC transporter substrate-binding protein [Planctomycetes bacterium]|nr:molybdate ABC transporter substrate-binding protein [Planctomycetota bacterium]
MSNSLKLAIVSVLAVAALVFLLREDTARNGGGGGDAGETLVMYCAAGIKEPVEKIAKDYQAEYGVEVQLQYGGSGTLLSTMQVARSGDLYLAADASYIEIAHDKNLLDETLPLAWQHPVIAVRPGNPKHILSVKDLAREDVKIALANPEAASIGKQTQKLLEKSGDWTAIKAAVEARGVFKPTVNEVANDVALQTVDAGVVWNSTAAMYKDVEMVDASPFKENRCNITVSVLRSCKQPTAALRFLRYLGARDKGLVVFREMGFEPVEGDEWAETPELNFFSGGVNRLAIEETLKEFEAREGCKIITTYNGCGILVGQMKAGARPDAYLACDKTFADTVQDLYLPQTPVSKMDLIVLVHKGNPKHIKSLKDLAQPGLKVGLGNPELAAFGKLTKELLQDEGLLDDVMKNCASQAPGGDLLVNQMSAGSLDASICYIVNAYPVKEKFEIISIDNPLAKASQPFQIGKQTKYPHLTARLRDTLLSAKSKARYAEKGFGWDAQNAPAEQTKAAVKTEDPASP